MQEFWKKKGKELGFLTDTEWDGWLQGRVDVAWFIKIRKREIPVVLIEVENKNSKERALNNLRKCDDYCPSAIFMHFRKKCKASEMLEDIDSLSNAALEVFYGDNISLQCTEEIDSEIIVDLRSKLKQLKSRNDSYWETIERDRKREEEFLDKARKNTKEFKEVLDKIDANQ